MPIDAHADRRHLRELLTGDKAAAAGPERSKLGDRFAISRHDKGLAGRHGLDHPRVLVPQVKADLRRAIGKGAGETVTVHLDERLT